MILKTNPSFVVMNDLMSSECLIIQRQEQPGGRGKGKSSLGSDLQAVLHLASQKGQLGGHGEDPTGLGSRAPRTERSPGGADIPPVEPDALVHPPGKRAFRIKKEQLCSYLIKFNTHSRRLDLLLVQKGVQLFDSPVAGEWKVCVCVRSGSC